MGKHAMSTASKPKKEESGMDKYKTWCGLGYKIGGTLFVPGLETIGGTLRNLGLLSEHHDFNILNIRLGLGLGGSAGTCACLVFDCLNLIELNNTDVSDWSINASLGAKWADLAKALGKYNFFKTLAKIATNSDSLKNATPEDIEKIRDGMSYFYTGAELAQKSKGPKLAIIDIPGAGVGVELSAYMTQGKIEMES